MKHALRGPVLLGLIVLLSGGGIMTLLFIFKRAPAEATVAREEKPIYVAVQSVEPEDVPVHIEGFGEVAARTTVTITPQVVGRVASVHPLLIAGGRVASGEVLFTVDPRPHASQVADAEAQLQRQGAALRRLAAEEANREADLKSVKRTGELAEQHYARAKELHAKGVGSLAAVDEAERALVDARNEIDQVTRSLRLFPIRRQETESEMASAQAQLDMAEYSLEQTRVLAPFDARVKQVTLEKNEVISLGTAAVVLVDDSILEISVPLNSQDARKWLQFESRTDATSNGWFGTLKPVPCQIRWTDDELGRYWEGTLDRVEDYNQESRTLTVVVRIAGEQILAPDSFPLVEGMFCAVTIPGRPMKGVYRLAPHVVSFENMVFVAEGDRLKTVPVDVVRIEEDFTYVSGGLSPGDRVITTRLVNPLDHSKLAIVEDVPAAAL